MFNKQLFSGNCLCLTFRFFLEHKTPCYHHVQVRKLKGGKAVKQTLTVDLQLGKYSVLKQTGKDSLAHTQIAHEKSRSSTIDKCMIRDIKFHEMVEYSDLVKAMTFL